MNKKCIIVCMGLVAMLMTLKAEFHQFKDISGRTFEAQIISVTNTKVRLANRDGKEINFPIIDLSIADKKYVRAFGAKADAEKSISSPVASDKGPSRIINAMKGKTVHYSNRKMVDKPEGINPNAEFIAIYYSAHWCPPCRAFTPDLVKFHKRYSAKYDNFEVVFVSSDRNEKDMEGYMKWAKMEFPALSYDQKRKAKDITKFVGRGIPCLVVVDRQGKVLIDGKTLGARETLKRFEKLIKSKS